MARCAARMSSPKAFGRLQRHGLLLSEMNQGSRRTRTRVGGFQTQKVTGIAVQPVAELGECFEVRHVTVFYARKRRRTHVGIQRSGPDTATFLVWLQAASRSRQWIAPSHPQSEQPTTRLDGEHQLRLACLSDKTISATGETSYQRNALKHKVIHGQATARATGPGGRQRPTNERNRRKGRKAT